MRILVLSPHRDDAAFSCGLLLSSLLWQGNAVVVVNICTVSDYAPYLAENGDARELQVTTARRAEDLAFTGRITDDSEADATAVQLIDLNWKDAPLRWSVDGEEVLAPVPLVQAEVESLVSVLRSISAGDVVLAPLALGGHVDHRLVREAAVRAFGMSSLLFYEDLPYACRMATPEREAFPHHELAWTCDAWLAPGEGSKGAKQGFASCYPSQIAPEVAEEMERYAAELGWRERFYGHQDAVRVMQQMFSE